MMVPFPLDGVPGVSFPGVPAGGRFTADRDYVLLLSEFTLGHPHAIILAATRKTLLPWQRGRGFDAEGRSLLGSSRFNIGPSPARRRSGVPPG